jgi:hypothetical protein
MCRSGHPSRTRMLLSTSLPCLLQPGHSGQATGFSVQCLCPDTAQHEKDAAMDLEEEEPLERDFPECYTLDQWICHCKNDPNFTNRFKKDPDIQSFKMVEVIECQAKQDLVRVQGAGYRVLTASLILQTLQCTLSPSRVARFTPLSLYHSTSRSQCLCWSSASSWFRRRAGRSW